MDTGITDAQPSNMILAAEADAALMDGHFAFMRMDGRLSNAAEADAALMDGHDLQPRELPAIVPAAEADAALMDGHSKSVIASATLSMAAEADAALMDGHSQLPADHPEVRGRGGRRGPDGWTRPPPRPPGPGRRCRGGRRGPDGWTREGRRLGGREFDAAEADAALMDGHFAITDGSDSTATAAEADAALMDGHLCRCGSRQVRRAPRRPTRP